MKKIPIDKKLPQRNTRKICTRHSYVDPETHGFPSKETFWIGIRIENAGSGIRRQKSPKICPKNDQNLNVKLLFQLMILFINTPHKRNIKFNVFHKNYVQYLAFLSGRFLLPVYGSALQRMRIHITDITPLKHMAFSELTFCSLLGMTLAVS